MRVTINLASRQFADIAPALKNLRNTMAALAGVAVLLLIGLYFVHGKAEVAREREHSFDGKISQLRQEQQRYQATMRQPDNARTLQQSESLNQLFDEKAFSWTLAMEDLETVLPAGVQVTTLEPTIKNGLITVHLRVIGPRDRDVQLVQNLEHSRHFVVPRIVGETAESSGGPNAQAQPVSASNRFDYDVLADYNPGPADQRKHATSKAGEGAEGSASGAPHSGMARPHAPAQPHRGVAQ
ncbi:MAG: fimbrial assembly protein [Acidobacteria bacterium]|nr:fimbrial assembly protein [Acidobacteriota bacterium]